MNRQAERNHHAGRLAPICREHRLALGRCELCDGWDRSRPCFHAIVDRDGELDPRTGEARETDGPGEFGTESSRSPGSPPPGQAAEPSACEVPPRLQAPAGRNPCQRPTPEWR